MLLYLEQSLYPVVFLYQGVDGSADHGEYLRTHYIQTKLIRIRTEKEFFNKSNVFWSIDLKDG